MIVTTDKASLSNALAIVSRSVNARVILPIIIAGGDRRL